LTPDGLAWKFNPAMSNPPKLPSALPLRRYPVRKGERLRAWDAADELIVEELVASTDLARKRILILNDAFGALGTALADFAPTVYSDSYLATQALERNSGGRVRATSRLADLAGPYDLVLARVPKNLSFFEDELARIGPYLAPGAKLVAGVMVKHQSAGAFDLIAKYFGATRTSLARKKARLIFATFSRESTASPYPLAVKIEGFPLPFTNHANVFSREKLDVGTRFFLDHLPVGDFRDVLDLGCGNGLVGVAAKRKNPDAKLVFTDESRMAIESAEANFRAYYPDAPAEFHWTNAFETGAAASVDLVLCNPPFHQGTTVGDFVAREMFRDAYRVLRSGGLLRAIGNSHLGYPAVLGRLFGSSEVVAKNAKFTIVDARKR